MATGRWPPKASGPPSACQARCPSFRIFYDALRPRLEACATYLDQFPVDDMPPDAQRLLWLTLSLMEVANAVELYKQPRLSNGFEIARFIPLEKDTST